MDEKQLKIEKKKLLIKQAKVIEGQIRDLILLIIAIGGGVGALIVNFSSYEPKSFVISLVSIGNFILFFLIWHTFNLWFELEKLKSKMKE